MCAERRDSILSVRPGCGEIESKRGGVGGRLVKFSHLRSGRAPRNSAESAVTRARCSLSARRASHPSARGQCRGWRCALSALTNSRRTPPLNALDAAPAAPLTRWPPSLYSCWKRRFNRRLPTQLFTTSHSLVCENPSDTMAAASSSAPQDDSLKYLVLFTSHFIYFFKSHFLLILYFSTKYHLNNICACLQIQSLKILNSAAWF